MVDYLDELVRFKLSHAELRVLVNHVKENRVEKVPENHQGADEEPGQRVVHDDGGSSYSRVGLQNEVKGFVVVVDEYWSLIELNVDSLQQINHIREVQDCEQPKNN